MDSEQICTALERYLKEILTAMDKCGASEKVINWVVKKGRIHPHQVFDTMREIEKSTDVAERIKKLGLDENYAFNTAETIALLHDTGRLKEIDMSSGKFVRSEDLRGTSHEIESCIIAEKMGISDLNVLLPIKYHDAFAIEDKLHGDDVFQELSAAEQQKVLFFAFIIQDADKTANMKQYCLNGIKNTSETLDPAYTAKAEVTPDVKDSILNGRIPLKTVEKTYIDALLRYLSLSFTFNFSYSKNLFKEKILDGIFVHVLNEIEQNAQDEIQAEKARADAEEIYRYLKNKRN